MTRARAALKGFVHLVAGTVTVALYLGFVVPWSRMRGRSRRPAILWAPQPIINVRYSALADRLYGYRSETLVYGIYRINARDQFDYVLDWAGRMPGVRTLVPYGTFLWAGVRFDIFGFFFDGGLLGATPWWRVELRLLRLAGKCVVVYPYGSDARRSSATRRIGRWNAYTDIPVGDEDRDERDVELRVAAFARHATVMLGCADLCEDLPRCDGMLRYPFDLSGWDPVEAGDRSRVIVAHAPNHRSYKGTRYLVEAIEELRAEGVDVELDLIEGVPFAEARSRFERADVIADQFLIGAYALFAIEGMALGKPVVCYLNPRFLPGHPEWEECPVVTATPETLKTELRQLLEDEQLRREIGSRGPEYVRRYHSLEVVGAEMDAIYRRIWR